MKQCKKCGYMYEDDKQFFYTNHLRYNNHRLDICKECMSHNVDINNSDTFLSILKAADVPYIKKQWKYTIDSVQRQGIMLNAITVLNRYISLMQLKSFKDFRFKDSSFFNEIDEMHELQREKCMKGVCD